MGKMIEKLTDTYVCIWIGDEHCRGEKTETRDPPIIVVNC